MSEPAIVVDGVSKVFRIPHQRNTSLKQSAVNLLRPKSFTILNAVDDVSFDVKQGEFFGIVGRNGCGKSTMLKMLAGIYVPTGGNITINGTLSPFIELGVGFSPELSARDNIYLSGAILGLSRKKVESVFDEVIRFAELEEFVDQKLKNFSSGMQVRLAFSLSIQAQSDILLVDEVLAVGDANFQAKCYNVFRKMKRDKKTVIFVSHDMGAVMNFCDRAVLLNDGAKIIEGRPDRVINTYNNLSRERAEVAAAAAPVEAVNSWGDGAVEITDTWTEGKSGRQKVFTDKERITVGFDAVVRQPIASPLSGFILRNAEGLRNFTTNTKDAKIDLGKLVPGQKISARYTLDNVFANGLYEVSPAITDETGEQIHHWVDDAISFEVTGRANNDGLTFPKTDITMKASGGPTTKHG